MLAATSGDAGGGTPLLGDDVISVIAAMMHSATVQEVREALRQDGGLGCRCLLTDLSAPEANAEAEQPPPCGSGTGIGSQATTSHLAVCEFVERHAGEEEVAAGHHVVATHDVSAILQRHAEAPLSRTPSMPPNRDGAAGTPVGTMTTPGAVAGPTGPQSLLPVPSLPLPPSSSREMVRCVLLSRRHPTSSSEAAAARTGPLTLRHLNLHAIEMQQPLEGLQTLLEGVYEPLLRSKREVTLRSQMQDLLSSIRSHCQVLAEVDLKIFVHADLLEVCAAYPEADVEHLLEILGPEACTDSTFLLQVMALRSQCRGVLETKFEGREIVSSRDEVAYWQAVLRWVEQVQKQLQSREWQLVHRLLGNRVETSYEVEFRMHAKLVREYLTHLKSVPFQQIDEVEEDGYAALVEELFLAMERPTKYPALQRFRLLESIVRELVERFVAVASKSDVLRMGTPEAQLQCLRRTIHVLQDLHQRYLQTAELFCSAGHLPTPLPSTRGGTQQPKRQVLVLARARQLWGFVNEHFHYERALQRTFADGGLGARTTCSFHVELTEAYDHFAAATVERGCLWDISSSGTAEFQRALAAYERRLADIDERLALLVGTMLATAQEMSSTGSSLTPAASPTEAAAPDAAAVGAAASRYSADTGPGPSLYRIYSRFRPLRREKVQAVVAGFQMALLEQINREMKEVRERYFDADSCRDGVRITVSRFGVTSVVGRMLWERSVQQEIEAYLERRDAIYEHGWHQLLHLRTIEHHWCLDESLAQFFGVPLHALTTKELEGDLDVSGTAYALAYLDLVHGKDEPKWSADPHIQAARIFLQECDASAIDYAKSRLVLLRVGSGRGVEQSELRDVRNFCEIISQRIRERVVQWCEDVRRRIAALNVSPDTMTMKGPLWHVVQQPRGRGRGRGGMSIIASVGNDNGGTATGGMRRIVMPHIPQEMFALLQDLHMLEGMQLLENHLQLVADVRSFFLHNEERFRIANCLSALIHAFETALDGEDEMMVHLATEEYAKVHQTFLDGAQLRWSDEERLQQYTQELSDRVYAFCVAAARVREVTADMERGVAQLHSRAVQKAEAVVWRVGEMHSLVNVLYANCANAGWWVRRLQPRLDAAIVWQLEQHLRRWSDEFFSMSHDQRFLDKGAETEEFGLRPLRVRMRVVFKEIALSSPAAACRHHWLNELNRSFAWVHTLSTLRQDYPHQSHQQRQPSPSAPYQQPQQQQQVLAEWSSSASALATYERVLEWLPPQFLAEPLQAIEKTIRDAVEVEAQWRRGQQLLNLEVGVLQQRLGDDLEKWGEALQKIREMAGSLMDYTQPSTLVGGIVIVADDAQKELGRKLDNLTQYIHSRYRDVVEKRLESCYHGVMGARAAAENCNVINNLEDAARFICELPEIRGNMQATERQIASLTPAEDYLRRQGFALPDSWIYVRKLKTEYRAYHDLIERKVKALEFRRPFLCESLKPQEEDLSRQIDEVEASLHTIVTWVQDQEQAQLEEVSDSAQRRFSEMQEWVARLKEQRTRLTALQAALGVPILAETKLEAIMARMEEMQWVCGHVARAYQRLHALARTPFSEMVPRQLHEELVAIDREVREFPEGVRTHQAYNELQLCVESRLACRQLMQELRSDAMTPLERAERHWMALKSQLHAPWKLEALTVGDIWRSNPVENAKIYHDVLEFAHGELRLESQLGHIIGFWNTFAFNTMVYRHQFVLVRGWDVVFERLSDDLDSFQGLRSSPFFSSQHVIAMVADWDTRLQLLLRTLEVLMVVQRRWVHLDSIFTGNADIRRQLSKDAIQFDRATREFMKLMPAKASLGAAPVLKAQDFLQDKKLLTSLERLEGQLSRVQRALSTYLDLQRRQFPRLFFVGDDDLLETLGNSSNPTLIEKHLPKMFTALARFIIGGDESEGDGAKDGDSAAPIQVMGFASAEGEKVMLERPVALKDRPLHDWLAEVEASMVTSLCRLTRSAVESLTSSGKVTTAWITSFPLQVVCLAFQVWWVRLQEQTFLAWQRQGRTGKKEPSMAVAHMVSLLDRLAVDGILPGTTLALRHGMEELITLAVYQRDVSRVIDSRQILSADEFEWLRVLRLYLGKDGAELQCQMADTSFRHGFEYLGWHQRLVQTTLTDRCYLTMTQALHARLGGSPVGPAGSGKTETVKALGTQLGRHVLVFNCDDTFDFDAVGRILLGLCQVGAWGCFDEFNRLEERVLSAVSQQIQTIQEALRTESDTVTLAQQTVPLRESVALFITMNPGFAGRSNLPGNLKQLFRTMTMAAPDRETIAEVMLFAQGFRTAEALSRKIAPLFHLCSEKLSQQAHYDFGLRALKSVLLTAGDLRRSSREDAVTNPSAPPMDVNLEEAEGEIMLQSLISSITPRLVTEDVALFYPLLRDFFRGLQFPGAAMTALRVAIDDVCRETHYVATPAWVEKVCQLYHTRKMRHGLILVGPSGTGKTACWKTLLRAMARLTVVDSDAHDGGGGSPTEEGVPKSGPLEAHAYLIDPKAMSKAELFGVFEATTREWKDGVFTEILRRIVTNEMGDDRSRQQHWIIFDGDVDPHWVENLNSLLDDNKVYTLPNGERLSLPPSVRIVFEVQDLRCATPATVSRCGMIWFNRGTVPVSSVLSRHFGAFYRVPLIDGQGKRRLNFLTGDSEEHKTRSGGNYFMVPRRGGERGGMLFDVSKEAQAPATAIEGDNPSPTSNLTISTVEESFALGDGGSRRETSLWCSNALTDTCREVMQLQMVMANVWGPAFAKGGLLERAIQLIHSEEYWKRGIMEHSDLQMLRSVQSFLLDGISRMWKLREQRAKLPMVNVLQAYAANVLLYAVLWGFTASLSHELRRRWADDLSLALGTASDGGLAGTLSLLDVQPDPLTGAWSAFRERVRDTAIAAEQLGANDVIIPTVDTCRHEEVLRAWINGGNTAILCGPPGSGKTMLIASLLQQSSEYDAVFLNFSSGTKPKNIIRALEQYCSVQNTARGPVMSPTGGKGLLLFCDEINLPAMDQYGTQPVVQLLRQLIQRRGYYRSRDNAWINVEGVQVIGACNPPTDAGRVSLSQRFLRLAPVLFVDFPTKESLHMIYAAYCRAVLVLNSRLQRSHAEKLSCAMVEVYTATQAHFTSWRQPHYVYSPRDLSRWTRAVYNALLTWDEPERRALRAEGLVRLSVHEGLRVFRDRLVEDEERDWTDATMDRAFLTHFPEIAAAAALPPPSLRRPVLYSTILRRSYSESARDVLRAYIEHKLEVFCEEEVDTTLVVHDAVIDHVTRINRVLQQPLGHMLIAGASGVGKTITARLVAWMNGMALVRLGVHRNYQLDDYERDLRDILRRAGCKLERVCFLFDDSNIMEASFLEYMNALLASGEVPGLFEGEEWGKLMEEIRESVVAQQLLKASGKPQKLPQLEDDDDDAQTQHDHQPLPPPASTLPLPSGKIKHAATGSGATTAPQQEALDTMVSAAYVDTTSEQELYRWFLGNVKRNLHVIFTIDPSAGEFAGRAVASPALFNRCTIDWFGEWDRHTRYQVTRQLTEPIDIMFSCGNTFLKRESEARDALADALCGIHEIADEVNRVVRLQNAQHGTFITPRHFADCVRQLQLLYEEKKGGSKEQVLHLRSGLAKLDAASDEVEQQQAKLHEHEAVLATNSTKAQMMLDRIVTDTETTKREKQAAERLRQQLQEEEELIVADKAQVQQQLSEAEPALREAEIALNTIRPEYLREIRAYTTPPQMVQRVLEAVLAVMGEKRADEWDVIKHHIRRDDFLAGVKAFEPRSITEEARLTVRQMLQEEDFTYGAAQRASKAAGPLLQWVGAQVKYAEILTAMEPLRTRIDHLTEAHSAKHAQLQRTEAEIAAMEASLLQLKEGYQEVTEEIAGIKNTMSGVAARCERATKLLRQLFDERGRWETEALGFDSEVRTILGDCTLAAASLAYFGYFDEHTRQSLLLPRWRRCLQQMQIPFREELRNAMEYLVTPQERLSWELHGLPKDHLCIENAMILSRCQRYPFIIDPNGVAVSFLLQQHATDKIHTTSFSKTGYLKQLDMAVRFGYPILMQDAEFIDPALNSLINKEIHRVQGHALTRLGAQDVEMAAAFRLFLVTRDSHYQPSPGMAGQVCLVNFTVTQSSLQSQCRHRVMLHEHSELDVRRAHILRAQGEYQLRLRVLEQELLTSIARSEGSLLENDSLTVVLERLKGETESLKAGIAESEASMQVITEVEAQYQPIAAAVAKIYFALRRFSQLHWLYQFNVEFIFRILADALALLPARSADVGGVEERDEDAARLQVLTREVFNLVHQRVRRGIFAEDHLVLAILLGKLRSGIDDRVGRQITLEEWSWFEDALHDPAKDEAGVTAAVAGPGGASHAIPVILRECGVCVPASEFALAALLQRPLFAEVRASLQNPQHGAAWRRYLESAAPYAEVMPAFQAAAAKENSRVSHSGSREHTRRAFLAAFFLLYTRRDAFAPAVREFLQRFFDEEPPSVHPDNKIGCGSFFTAEAPDLAAVQAELSNSTPLILVANAGSDPTLMLETLARALDVTLRVAVMGSATGLDMAERYLTDAMAEGTWVLLKNIHLARTYADATEKWLHRELSEGRLHRNFRLVLSIEAAPGIRCRSGCGGDFDAGRSNASGNDGGKRAEEALEELPVSLVEASVVLVYEPPPGMKSSLLQTVGALKPHSSCAKQPADIQRIYLAAAWLHAVVMERLLYIPMGWSSRYEFTDTEFWRILQAVDSWVGTAVRSGGRGGGERVDRDRVSWPALQTIVGTTLYGGKITNEFDQLLLDCLCSQLMSKAVFDDDRLFALTDDEELNARLMWRSIQSLQDVQAWVRALPDAETPLWARLPASASRVVSAQHAVATIERLALVRLIEEGDNEVAAHDDAEAGHELHAAPRSIGETHWGQQIQRFCRVWHSALNGLGNMKPRQTPVTSSLSFVAEETATGGDASVEPTAMAIEREYSFALDRRREILEDLAALEEICAGSRSPTATQRGLMDHVLRDQVPPHWARSYHTFPTTADQWMSDFMSRVAHVQAMHEAVRQNTFETTCLSLGLLFWPGAFLTATKQQAARRQHRSLEQLQLRLELMSEDATQAHAASNREEPQVWHLVGLTLYSARLVANCGKCELLPATSGTSSAPIGALLHWEPVPAPAADGAAPLASKSSLLMRLLSQNPAHGRFATPFYMNPRRDTMLEVVEIAVDPVRSPMRAWYERGVCLVACSLAER
ncbi:cytoplasmic dynein 1 heavy chain 1 [Trypanosoma conorhini]|uniref:Cytoplasmic dynein 1 heavy chain 1 n=1 Tax=Trypanosoma conorhini TaxID=83891 RepID=A0A422Q2B2_9TRYP|nr:cytoplasmic dynein 1 heavy chain 1 [Trypanosoma conorhini]RNF24116.1 cytoplasmic dynein 1 heavy chain 1 [Trypanosoma conorhini]